MVRMYQLKTEDGRLFQRVEARDDSDALHRATLYARRLNVYREDTGELVGKVERNS